MKTRYGSHDINFVLTELKSYGKMYFTLQLGGSKRRQKDSSQALNEQSPAK
jgi:hypothetical protein